MAEQRLSQDVTEFFSSDGAQVRLSQDVTEYLSRAVGALADHHINQDVTEYLYTDEPMPPELWLSQDVTEYLYMATEATVDCPFGSSFQAGVLRGQASDTPPWSGIGSAYQAGVGRGQGVCQ